MPPTKIRTARAVLLAALIAVPGIAAAAAPRTPAPPRVAPAATDSQKIVAVVNGDIITTGDVIARGRLFALSTGLPVTPEVLERLRPQIVRQLIDERLRLQEAQRRKVVVGDREIASAITDIEQRNGLPPGRLADSLKGQGIALRTLIDQTRVQIGWSRVLRQELGTKTDVSAADIAEQDRIFKQQVGKPEFRVGEIFIPIDDPARANDAQKFAEEVISQLRAGAPFGVVAAQFSQSQTALQGGDLGWVSNTEMDPEVAAIISQMPVGAVSNPVRVPGGISIVTLRAKRDIGRERSTVVDVRQAFYPFVGTVNPQAPTDQQRKAVETATATARSVHSCAMSRRPTSAPAAPAPPTPARSASKASARPRSAPCSPTPPSARPPSPSSPATAPSCSWSASAKKKSPLPPPRKKPPTASSRNAWSWPPARCSGICGAAP